MRPINVIYSELHREQKKLNMMPLTDQVALLRQSVRVDELVVEYQRALLQQQKETRVAI